MASRKVTAADLPNALKQILDEYADTLARDIDEAAEETAKKGQQALQHESPVRDGNRYPIEGRKPGTYARGWRVNAEPGRLYTKYEIHNKQDPTLTHLLEYGHALVRGGRTVGWARAYPHIGVVAKQLPDDFEKEVINAIRRCNESR